MSQHLKGSAGRFLVGLGAMLIGVLSGSCSDPSAPSHSALLAPLGGDRPKAKQPDAPILTVPPARMRDLVIEDSLLRPDRRFVMAFEEVVRLGTGKKTAATLTRQDRSWQVDVGLPSPASLSGIPSFGETFAALRASAARIPMDAKGRKLPTADLRRLEALASDPFGDGPERALKEVDRLWAGGASRVQILDLASRALTTLLVQRLDYVDMADVVGARALSTLVLAEVSSGKSFPERQVLLACFLGYPGEARKLAASLPPQSPERLYLLEEHGNLQALAEGTSSPPLTRYLHLLLFSTKGKREDVKAWWAAHAPAPPNAPGESGGTEARQAAELTVDLCIQDGSFDHELNLNTTLMRIALGEVGIPEPSWEPGLLAAFERALASRPRLEGPFLDTEVVAALHRARFYSGLYGAGSFYLDSLSSGPAAQQFASVLEGADPGAGAEFQRWFSRLTAAKNGTIPVARLLDDLNALPNLGQAAVRRLGEELEGSLTAIAPERPEAGARLARLLDSRPKNNLHFSNVCRASLLDPMAAQEYYLASGDRYERESGIQEVWDAYKGHDLPRLRSRALDASEDTWARVTAIGYLDEKNSIPGEELRAQLLDVLARSPEDATALKAVRLLWERGFLADAEGFLRKWLDAHADAHVLTRALYASRLSHVLILKGGVADSWAVIEPYVPTGQSDAVGYGAKALAALGRREEALELARQNVERYPDGDGTRSASAQVFWAQGKHREAAQLLSDPRYPISSEGWQSVVSRDFYDVFAGAKAEETLAAMGALIDSGVNSWFLFEMTRPFARRQRLGVATAMLDAIARSKNETIDGHLWAYRYRKLEKGPESAAAWLRETVLPSKSAGWVPEVAFDEREFEVLWLCGDSELTWLLRAEAAALEGGAEGARRDALEAYYRDPGRPTFWATYGLYVLGLLPEEKLLESATDAERRCDVAFLMGLKAAGEKRLRDACDWFRACIKTGRTGRTGYGRSREFLRNWDTRRFGVRGGADLP